MKLTLSLLDQILRIHKKDETVLPLSVVKHIQSAKEIIVKDKIMIPHWQGKV